MPDSTATTLAAGQDGPSWLSPVHMPAPGGAHSPRTAAAAGGLECRGRSGGKAITDMDVRSYIEENSAAFFSELKEWLTIPSISADPGRHADVRASAQWLAPHQRGIGVPQVESWGAGHQAA